MTETRHVLNAAFGFMALLAVTILWPLAQASAAETILEYDSHVVIAESGQLTVTERIRVRAEGKQIRRGIYRDFPLLVEDAEGREREVGFNLVSVTRDGKAEPHHTERTGRIIRIYIGDADTFLDNGVYTYVIRYTTDRQIRFFRG